MSVWTNRQVRDSAVTRERESLGGSRAGANQSLCPPHRYYSVKINIKVSPDVPWKDFPRREQMAMPGRLSNPCYSDNWSIFCSCAKIRLGLGPNDILGQMTCDYSPPASSNTGCPFPW